MDTEQSRAEMDLDQDQVQGKDKIPGTTRLVDLDHVMLKNKKHAGNKPDIVLVPTPSDDPDDPLNWSPRRKQLAASCIVVYTVTVGIASAAIYSVLVPISKETGLTLANLNAGTGYMFLLFGWGCLISQPLALKYGKRPIFLVSVLGTMAVMVWTPYTKTSGQYLATKILQGFFGSPIESLVEQVVADVWFQHERGLITGLYAFSLVGSSYFAPIIAGFIAQGQGWSWVLFWCAIFLAVAFVYLFLFMEETNYDRVIRSPPSQGSTAADYPDKQEFSVTSLADPLATSTRPRKTFFQKLSVLPHSRPRPLFKMIPRPFILLSFPIIAWAGLTYGFSLITFNLLNGTASLILSGAPYHFRTSSVGLAYFGPLVGACVTSFAVGPLSDWLMIKLARRNGGIVEPEYRLWWFGIVAALKIFSLLLWGVGAAHGVHWFGLVFSMGATAAGNCLSIQLSLLYIIDSYRELSGEAIVSVILVRNTMSFALGYGLTPWINNMGLQNAFITAAFVAFAEVMTFLVFVKWGKKMRANSMARYWRYVRSGKEIGMVE